MKVVRKEIDVLCWFDQQGYPNPVRFRIIDETKSQQVIKIDKVVTREFEKLAGNKMFVFTCQCVIQEMLRTIVIKYELESCRWILFKY
ncbi:MAG: hypothetical protein BGO41_13440 [Clostridiales bacterium 38-18]|nr:MAG: hypothetical protein BGO41_13440 [Clostridiales bacterium 38-18]